MSLQLFDRLRAFIKSANIYGHENLLQNQNDINRAVQDGELINYSSSGLLDQTNLQINRMERYKDYDQMDEMGEISLALDLYADESTQIDPESGHVVSIKAKNKKVKEELEDLFFDTLNIDNKLRSMVRYLCKYGDFASEIIPDQNRSSVISFRPFNIYSFLRVETKYGDLVGFFFTDEMMSEPIFLHPWQVMHLRLTSYENVYAPYGKSYLDGGRKDFRRLRLMEDAALIYRITRAPEKRIFTIPVGNIPTAQIGQYLNQIADQFKKQRFYDPATGEVNWRYSPLIQEDDFWLPRRPDGTGPEIDTLKGAENLDQIADIEYFKKKMVAPLKIPFSRVGIGEDSGANSDKSLASTHTEFAKAIQFVQNEICIGLKKIALVHLALRGFDAEDLSEFDIRMTSSSAIDELYRIETWNSRAGVISTLRETGMFPDDWILQKFTDMTDDEIEEIKKLKEEQEGKSEELDLGGLGGLGGEEGEEAPLGLPGLEDIDKKEAKLINEYRKYLSSKSTKKPIKYFDVFKYMINNNELDGLKINDSEQIIQDDIEKEGDDPFTIFEDKQQKQPKSSKTEEAIDFEDEEHKIAYAANKEILTQIVERRDTESMSYNISNDTDIERISDDMDE